MEGKDEEHLWKALRHRRRSIRGFAAAALVAIDEDRPSEPLLHVLREASKSPKEGPPDAAEVIELGLGRLKSLPLVDIFAEGLGSKDARLRRLSALALGETKDKQAIGHLIKAMRDPDARLRAAAAHGLGSLRDHRAIAPLIAALNDDNRFVRRTAAKALVRFGREADDALLEHTHNGSPRVRRAAARILRRRTRR
jgi:HEAT repeat protein